MNNRTHRFIICFKKVFRLSWSIASISSRVLVISLIYNSEKTFTPFSKAIAFHLLYGLKTLQPSGTLPPSACIYSIAFCKVKTFVNKSAQEQKPSHLKLRFTQRGVVFYVFLSFFARKERF